MAIGLCGLGVISATTTGEATAGALTLFLATMAVAVAGFAFLNPSVSALISRRSDPARQGEVLGVNQSANAMARILGPLVGLSVFDVLPSHVLPYSLGAGLLVIVFVLSLRIREA